MFKGEKSRPFLIERECNPIAHWIKIIFTDVCNHRFCNFVKHSEYRPNLTPLSSMLNSRSLWFNLQSQRGQDQSSKSSGSKAGPNTESVQDPDQDLATAIKTGNKQMKLVSEKSLGLDQAILHSISCCRKWRTLLLQLVNFCKCILVSFWRSLIFCCIVVYINKGNGKTSIEFSQQESDLWPLYSTTELQKTWGHAAPCRLPT